MAEDEFVLRRNKVYDLALNFRQLSRSLEKIDSEWNMKPIITLLLPLY